MKPDFTKDTFYDKDFIHRSTDNCETAFSKIFFPCNFLFPDEMRLKVVILQKVLPSKKYILFRNS